MLTPDEARGRPTSLSAGQEVAWTFALVFFGVFLAAPLRHQLIVVEQLKFPSGTATAVAIHALNSAAASGSSGGEPAADDVDSETGGPAAPPVPSSPTPLAHGLAAIVGDAAAASAASGASSLRTAGWALLAAVSWTFLAFFVPVLAAVPVFGLAGGAVGGATAWGWTLSLSPSGMGQGAIMGLHTCVSMMAGAVVGWGVLGPLAVSAGWCSSVGEGRTYILWVSLAILLADAALGMALTVTSMLATSRSARAALQSLGCGVGAYAVVTAEDEGGPGSKPAEAASCGVELSAAAAPAAPGTVSATAAVAPAAAPVFASPSALPSSALGESASLLPRTPRPPATSPAAPPDTTQAAAPVAGGCLPPLARDVQVPLWMWASGLAASTACAMGVLPPLMGLPWWEPLIAVAVSLPVAVIAVRALGQTDLNPVSGVGKLAQ